MAVLSRESVVVVAGVSRGRVSLMLMELVVAVAGGSRRRELLRLLESFVAMAGGCRRREPLLLLLESVVAVAGVSDFASRVSRCRWSRCCCWSQSSLSLESVVAVAEVRYCCCWRVSRCRWRVSCCRWRVSSRCRWSQSLLLLESATCWRVSCCRWSRCCCWSQSLFLLESTVSVAGLSLYGSWTACALTHVTLLASLMS